MISEYIFSEIEIVAAYNVCMVRAHTQITQQRKKTRAQINRRTIYIVDTPTLTPETYSSSRERERE